MYFNNIKISNSLELVSQSIQRNKILTILKSFKKIIAFGMSGSGSSCFGIFNHSQDFKMTKSLKY